MTEWDGSILTPHSLLEGDVQLASSPNLYFAFKRVIEDPRSSVVDAADVIERDPALAIRLLKMVNSAFYGVPRQITSIAKAIVLIGERELQNLLIGMVIVERFSDLPGFQATIHDFWASSLRCALITRNLDQLTGGHFAESAFVCGLLHNIGQMVFYRKIPLLAHEVFSQIYAQFPNPVNEQAIERQVIGFDRFAMGAALCQRWQLPEVICESIRLHGHPETATPYAPLLAMLRLAQQLSRIDLSDDLSSVDGITIDFEALVMMLDQVHEEFEAIFKLFYPQV